MNNEDYTGPCLLLSSYPLFIINYSLLILSIQSFVQNLFYVLLAELMLGVAEMAGHFRAVILLQDLQ